jgi:hypothetical protein
MYKRVIFSFKATGAYDDLEVYAGNERISNVNGKGKVDDHYSTGYLSMRFQFYGDKGTDFKI